MLAALTSNTLSRSLRQLSVDSGVSWSRTADIVDDLADLGLVERRQTPGAVLVRLVTDNVVARLVQQAADLRSDAIEGMREAAGDIRPAPRSLVVFGSFARGTADRDSDVDVVAVTTNAVGTRTGSWEESMGRWVATATAIAGNPVKLIEVAIDELASTSAQLTGWLQEASEQGIVLAGEPLSALMTQRKVSRRRSRTLLPFEAAQGGKGSYPEAIGDGHDASVDQAQPHVSVCLDQLDAAPVVLKTEGFDIEVAFDDQA